jgi:hypothetical protein
MYSTVSLKKNATHYTLTSRVVYKQERNTASESKKARRRISALASLYFAILLITFCAILVAVKEYSSRAAGAIENVQGEIV